MNIIEKEKYEYIWNFNEYRLFSPGYNLIKELEIGHYFLDNRVSSILDAGCGNGDSLRYFHEEFPSKFKLVGYDIAKNCLSDYWKVHSDDMEFKIISLDEHQNTKYKVFDAVICTDVLEHIKTESIPTVLENLNNWCSKSAFLSIALFEDSFGPKLIKKPLHLTVKPMEWWIQKVTDSGFLITNSFIKSDDNNKEWLNMFIKPF